MNKYILLFTIALTSCGTVARAENIALSTPAENVTNNENVTINETATPEPPTPDYQATSAYWATQSAQDRQAALDSREAELSARQTEQGAGLAVAQMTQAAEYLRATQTVESATEQAGARYDDLTRIAFVAGATQTGQVLAREQTDADSALFAARADKLRADTEANTATGNMIIGGVLSFAVVIFLLWLFLSVIYHLIEQNKERPEPLPVSHISHINSATPGGYGTTRRVSDPPGDTEKIRMWAVAALAGESIAVDPWEASGVFPGNREYRHGVYAWVMAHRLDTMNKSGERVLSEDGKGVISDWLIRHPLPQPENPPMFNTPPAVGTETVRTEAEGRSESETK